MYRSCVKFSIFTALLNNKAVKQCVKPISDLLIDTAEQLRFCTNFAYCFSVFIV